MTLTTQQKHVLTRLRKGYALIWTPRTKYARFWMPSGKHSPTGYVYSVTFDALKRRGVIECTETLPAHGGIPEREVWRACA